MTRLKSVLMPLPVYPMGTSVGVCPIAGAAQKASKKAKPRILAIL
jgi:hypothetical protein